MERSAYLTQALQAMNTPAPQPAAPAIDPAQLADQIAKAKAFKAANPGQSYLQHNLSAAGQNLMGAPGRAMGAVKGLFGLGQAAGG